MRKDKCETNFIPANMDKWETQNPWFVVSNQSIEIMQYNLFFYARYIWFGHIISSGFSEPHHNASITSEKETLGCCILTPHAGRRFEFFRTENCLKTVSVVGSHQREWSVVRKGQRNCPKFSESTASTQQHAWPIAKYFVDSLCFQYVTKNVCNPTPQEMPKRFRFGLELLKGIHFWTGPFPHESICCSTLNCSWVQC